MRAHICDKRIMTASASTAPSASPLPSPGSKGLRLAEAGEVVPAPEAG
jgi:hypothetical protein